MTEHGITGDILIHLDHEALKDVGIHSVVRLHGPIGTTLAYAGMQGQRLSILKAVYGYKLRDEIPIEQGHWVPPSEPAVDYSLNETVLTVGDTAEDMDEAMSASPTGSISSRHLLDLLGERGRLENSRPSG